MTPYLPKSLELLPKRMAFSTWVDHLAFGYDLVGALRPEVLVELGTQSGVSYFCFCQAVVEHELATRCFAIDTWRGDAHTSSYDETIWEAVKAHNESYASFSTLKRMLFEEASEEFGPDSIDLLHIDGYHTYEAVRGDFELWFPKVRAGGIVLFHDIAARIADFGAWRFWDELAKTHQTFWFKHGFGLGVLRKPGPTLDSDLLRFLFSEDENTKQNLRAFYVHAAEHLELLRKKRRLAKAQGRQRGSGR
jgi:predicted O-methyltransferase YrrM